MLIELSLLFCLQLRDPDGGVQNDHKMQMSMGLVFVFLRHTLGKERIG